VSHPTSATPPSHAERAQLHQARWELLEHLQALLARPMILLSFLWLGLIILGFTRGLSPRLSTLSYAIWGVFVLDFLLEFTIAPHKKRYLRTHWLTAVSLLLPALGIFRIFRGLQVLLSVHAAGYLSLLRLVTTLNRSLGALRRALGHRGIGYAVALTGLILLLGSAGMLAFENPGALHRSGFSNAQTGGGLSSYSDALWFTAMLMTTIGSGYSLFSMPGRVLCWLISIFSISIAGYLTASIASYFVGQDHQTGAEARPQSGSH